MKLLLVILGIIVKTIRRVVKKVASSQVAISDLESSGFGWAPGETPDAIFLENVGVPVLLRMLKMRTEIRGCLMMAGWNGWLKVLEKD